MLAQRASFDVTIAAGTLLAEAAPSTARPLLRERLVPPYPAPVREGLLRPWLSTFWKMPVVDPKSRLAAVMKLLASPLGEVAMLAEAELAALEADITPSRLGYAGWTLPVDTPDDAAPPGDPRKRAVLRAAVWSRLVRAPTASDVALACMLDPEAPAVLEAAATSKILAFGPHEVAILRTHS